LREGEEEEGGVGEWVITETRSVLYGRQPIPLLTRTSRGDRGPDRGADRGVGEEEVVAVVLGLGRRNGSKCW
jgi:hypothetical protein